MCDVIAFAMQVYGYLEPRNLGILPKSGYGT
jgi:hypothetical protein